MKKLMITLFLAACSFFQALADHYVSPGGTNNPPYTNWADAATNIQWAVDVATNNETVWVTNGTYVLTNQIFITNAIILKSVNGRDLTFINGNYPNITNRCIKLTNTLAVVDGFTVSNGYSPSDIEEGNGAGVYIYKGTIRNCVIRENTSTNQGGGIYVHAVGTAALITNCIIAHNRLPLPGLYGAGVALRAGKISTCTVASNEIYLSGTTRERYGAGINTSAQNNYIVIENCIVEANVSTNVGAAETTTGGGIYAWAGTTIRNCLIRGNRSKSAAGGLALFGNTGYTTTVENCTIAENYCEGYGGGMLISYSSWKHLRNNIIYGNTAGTSGSNYYLNYANCTNAAFSNNCFLPELSGAATNFAQNNINTDPLFNNPTDGDYRLPQRSPCVNAGSNQPWMTLDLDGRSRIDRFSGIVDMGAYEFVFNGTIYRIP